MIVRDIPNALGIGSCEQCGKHAKLYPFEVKARNADFDVTVRLCDICWRVAADEMKAYCAARVRGLPEQFAPFVGGPDDF